MDLEADVCIVGAGPGGALLGYLLAKNHLRVIVIERHHRLDKEFRGEHLNKDGESILRKYHLYDKVEAEGLLLTKRIEYKKDGKVFKTVFPGEGEGHVGIHVPQRNLLNVLIREAKAHSNYSLLMGTKVTELICDSNGKIAGVKAKTGEKDVTIHSRIVVGADGRFSTVRKLAQIPFQKITHGYDLLWAKIPAPKGWEPTIKNALVNDKQLALFSQAGGFIQIGWNIAEGSYPYLKQQSFEPFIRQAVEAFPELTDTIQTYITSWDDFILLNVHSIRCETWVKNGLTVIGDAAHTMSPTGAFGINCALIDADVLCDVIGEAMATNNFSEAVLNTFETARRDAVENLHRVQFNKEVNYKNEFASPALAH